MDYLQGIRNTLQFFLFSQTSCKRKYELLHAVWESQAGQTRTLMAKHHELRPHSCQNHTSGLGTEHTGGRKHTSKRASGLSDSGKVTQENSGRSENDWYMSCQLGRHRGNVQYSSQVNELAHRGLMEDAVFKKRWGLLWASYGSPIAPKKSLGLVMRNLGRETNLGRMTDLADLIKP